VSRKACGDLNQSLPVQRNIDFAEKRMNEDEYSENYGDNRKSPWYANFTGWLGTNFLGKDSIASVDKQRKYLHSQHKKNIADQKLLVANIQAMIQSNNHVAPYFWKWVQSEMNLLDSRLMRQRFPEFEIKMFKNPDGQMVPHLDTLPTGFLSVIHAELNDWINGGKHIKKTTGILHNLQVELLTPRTISRKDPSGMIAQMNGNLEGWNGLASSRAQDFYEPSQDGKRPGLNQISQKVREFQQSFDNLPIDVAWDVFLKFKRGQVFINPNDNNRLYMSTRWVQPRPGAQHKWLKSKDAILPYVYKDEMKNEFTVNPTDQGKGAFQQGQIEMLMEANKMLIDWYEAAFNELEATTIDHNKRRAKINELAITNNTSHLIDEVSEFGIFSEEIDIQGLSQIDKKEKFYMTRIYYQEHIPRLLQEALIDMKKKQDMLTSKMFEWDPTVSHTKQETAKQRLYEDRLDSLNADIYILEEKINSFEEGLIDPQHGDYIQAQSILKNFKRVTELIDPSNARTDKNVLKDYIDTQMRTVQRNEVSLDLMEALAEKGHIASPGVVDYTINHYKSSFYFPDAKTTYLGFKTDAKTWANRLNAIGINVDPQELSTFLRSVSSYFIFNALNGPLQGLTNYSNHMLKVHELGIDKFTHVMDLFNQNPQFWRELAGKSGVTTFTNFVEGYVQKGLREDEVAAMKGEMKLLKEEIKRADKTGDFNGLIKLQKRYKRLKQKEWAGRAGQVAQWAITRKIYYKKNESSIMKVIKSTAGEFYSKFPSIAETEQELRTLSFMIGVQDYIERNPGTKADSPEAIDAGIDYTQRVDFGLSHQHVGMAFRGPLGGFLTRMRIWHVQRFGFDINTYKQALREQTRPEMVIRYEDGSLEMDTSWLKKVGNKGKGMYGLFKGIVMPPGTKARNQRLDQKYTAKARSHFWMHAVATGIMDFGIFALAPPGAGALASGFVKASRVAYYRSPMGRGLTGFGSSAMSLAFGAIHLLGIMATGGFDDKDYTPEQFFSKYAYHIPLLGLGASIMLDLALGTMHNHRVDKAMGRHNYLTNHWKKLRVASPGGKVPWEVYDLLVEEEKDILEYNWAR